MELMLEYPWLIAMIVVGLFAAIVLVAVTGRR